MVYAGESDKLRGPEEPYITFYANSRRKRVARFRPRESAGQR